MNKLTKITSAHPVCRNVVRGSIRSDTDYIAVTRRRPPVCTWTTDPTSGRLVGSWSMPPCEEDYATARGARSHAASEIPIAA